MAGNYLKVLCLHKHVVKLCHVCCVNTPVNWHTQFEMLTMIQCVANCGAVFVISFGIQVRTRKILWHFCQLHIICQLQVWHITFKIIYKNLDISNVWSQNFTNAKWIDKRMSQSCCLLPLLLLCLWENQEWFTMEGFQSATILTLHHCFCQMM
jgi:hypothetical protein